MILYMKSYYRITFMAAPGIIHFTLLSGTTPYPRPFYWPDENKGNTIYGEEGDDLLVGSDSKDFLFGGTGDDVLNGGEGVDFLGGG